MFINYSRRVLAKGIGIVELKVRLSDRLLLEDSAIVWKVDIVVKTEVGQVGGFYWIEVGHGRCRGYGGLKGESKCERDK